MSGPRGPKTAREHPRSLPNSASERPWRSNEVHVVPKSPPEASGSLFWTPPGAILNPPGGDFHEILNPPAVMFNAALCAKLMQAYDRNRSTCLFSFCMWINFYMWISTATDNRSIDRGVLIHVLVLRRYFDLG